MYSFPTFLPFITFYVTIVRCPQNTMEAFKKKSNACSKSSHQFVPSEGLQNMYGALLSPHYPFLDKTLRNTIPFFLCGKRKDDFLPPAQAGLGSHFVRLRAEVCRL